jgi:hypothetical protein
MAVGLAGAIAGIYFLATGKDPDSFRLTIDDDVFALRLSPALEAAPQRGFVGLRGAF